MMKEVLSLPKYLAVSAAIHATIGLGIGSAGPAQLAGVAQTHRMTDAIQIASIYTEAKSGIFQQQQVSQSPANALSLQNSQKQKSNERHSSDQEATRFQSIDHSSVGNFGYHGVHVSEDGIPERYTSELHAYLQKYFGDVFEDSAFSDHVEVALHLSVSPEGAIQSSHVESLSNISGVHLSRISTAVRELTRVPPPGDLARQGLSVIVPVVFHP